MIFYNEKWLKALYDILLNKNIFKILKKIYKEIPGKLNFNNFLYIFEIFCS